MSKEEIKEYLEKFIKEKRLVNEKVSFYEQDELGDFTCATGEIPIFDLLFEFADRCLQTSWNWNH